MRDMFKGAVAFNQPLRFATPSVTDMSGMFQGALVFNSPLSFDVEVVATGRRALLSTGAQRPHFDTSSVTDMRAMFNGA
eukprot:scaffold137607_cov169-Phaeocystis_antarctica.AAC.1